MHIIQSVLYIHYEVPSLNHSHTHYLEILNMVRKSQSCFYRWVSSSMPADLQAQFQSGKAYKRQKFRTAYDDRKGPNFWQLNF